MSKGLEALEKIDQTVCMNNLENNIKWDIDKYDHCACVSVEDFVDCYEIIEKELKALEIIKKLEFEFEYNESTNSYLLHINKQMTWHLTQEEYELIEEVLL